MIFRLVLPLVVLSPIVALAQAPVSYRLSFPEPEHRWMQVEMTLPDLPSGALQLRMSRSSPGRYALHEFAKNVFDVRISDGAGNQLMPTRPNPHEWDVTDHDGTVRVTYKVFGDRIDGTYLAIDSTHAHINMPAALMWARGLTGRPTTIHFEPPTGKQWHVATQLMPGPDPRTFTAPNLQYLMDSPSEFSAFTLKTFVVEDGPRRPTFRIAAHHTGSTEALDAYVRGTEKIVREMKDVFGEYPQFENNTYTFIADYLPSANGDGMEHRNSTILTSSTALARGDVNNALGGVAHEFFHAWNVERIRPRSLEPFDFEEANMSGELWFAEGFTSYYGPLVMERVGLTTVDQYAQELTGLINGVALSPGLRLRTAEEMSQFAPFVDAATSIDRTNFANTFISYYGFGAAIGLALDLSLREHTEGRVTLDDFMRAMWQQFGKSGERSPGYVLKPYTMNDLKSVLASVAGGGTFASDFFSRYIQGHEVADYRALLARAGFEVTQSNPGAAWLGDLDVQAVAEKVVITRDVPFGSPAYAAGLERDDAIVSLAGRAVTSPDQLTEVIRNHKPGNSLEVVFERRGETSKGIVRLVEDPRIEIEPGDEGALTDAQRRFRRAWLSSRAPKP